MIFAGFLRGRSVEMVRCRTVDLEVPAESEVVLEGYVDATDLRPEGPFGDHTGFYTPVDDYPTFHLTGMSMRRDAIYATTIVGPAADGGLLPRQGHRAALPADPPDDAARPGGHEPPAGGRLPQLRDRLGAQALPRPREEADERRSGASACSRSAAAWWWWTTTWTCRTSRRWPSRPSPTSTPAGTCSWSRGRWTRSTTPRPYFAYGSKVGFDATRKWPGEGVVRPWPDAIVMSEDVRGARGSALGRVRDRPDASQRDVHPPPASLNLPLPSG